MNVTVDSPANGAPLRVAVLSDTHAWLHPAVADLVRDCDIAVHAGDICSASILEALEPRMARVVAVAGNNDVPGRWPGHEREMVAALPRQARIHLPGGILAVEHGEAHGFHTPDHESLRRAHPDARLIVYGHTHQRVIDDADAPWILNPGAAGRTRTHGGPSCALIEISEDDWRMELRVFDPDRT